MMNTHAAKRHIDDTSMELNKRIDFSGKCHRIEFLGALELILTSHPISHLLRNPTMYVKAFALALAAVAAAQSNTSSSRSESPPRTVEGEYGCYTDYGIESRSVVQTFSRLYRLTVPVTVYDYVTPPASTATVTLTSTLPPPAISVTPTITSTSTVFAFTSTTFTQVRTVPTGPAFTPLASALATQLRGMPSLDSADEEEAAAPEVDVSQRGETGLLKLTLDSSAAVVADPPLFEQQVVCERVIRVYATITSTFTAAGGAPTTTTTIVPGPTASNSVLPVPVTATTTTTSTLTVTVAATNPTFTAYEACYASNLVSYGPGVRPIVEAANGFAVTRERVYAISGYDCCVACQRTGGCTGSVHNGNQCFLFKENVFGGYCISPGDLRWSPRPGFGPAFTASNGECGSWRFSRDPPGSP
ncbi:hypothetical protein C8034_v012104 [Colletotrichum sidae]|uniref:Uncharacterized protein n=1 Tax=Colletotrichum sidae TaxID=1347389 RepID=A0A4R8TI98_9PEZI|nr:hypothetical protein C8034_v012104 [Colletotrichum sidae]